MSASELLQVLWRRKIVAGSIAALVVVVAMWSLVGAPDEYETRAKVALLPDPDSPQLVPFYGQAVESLLPTYAEIVESRSFLAPVARRLPFLGGPDELNSAVRADPVSRVGVLDIVATDGDPERAQQMAQATARALVERLADNGVVEVVLLDDARVPTEPTAPSAPLVLAVSVLVGLVLGGTAAVVRDRFFGRINESDDLARTSNLPILSVLPEMRRMRERSIVVGNARLVELEEAMRVLRTNILFAEQGGANGTTIISGLSPSSGKSTVAANLAVLLAELDLSVLLIDADLHRPVQHEIFGVSNDIGLTSMAAWGLSADSVALPTSYPNLSLVPAGPPIGTRSAELRIYRETLPLLQDRADVVIVDSPPLHAGDEVRMLAASGSRVLLLVRAGTTTPRQLQQDLQSLEIVGGEVLGLVLSRAEERFLASSYRQYRPASERESWSLSSLRRPDTSSDGASSDDGEDDRPVEQTGEHQS